MIVFPVNNNGKTGMGTKITPSCTIKDATGNTLCTVPGLPHRVHAAAVDLAFKLAKLINAGAEALHVEGGLP